MHCRACVNGCVIAAAFVALLLWLPPFQRDLAMGLDAVPAQRAMGENGTERAELLPAASASERASGTSQVELSPTIVNPLPKRGAYVASEALATSVQRQLARVG